MYFTALFGDVYIWLLRFFGCACVS